MADLIMNAELLARCTRLLVAFGSDHCRAHESVTVGPEAGTAFSVVGALGDTSNTIGRIMSFSSWPSRWQCQTYSQPKLTSELVTVIGSPVTGLKPADVTPTG